MDKSTSFGLQWLKGLVLFVPALLLQSCGSPVGVLKGVSPVQPIPAVGTTPLSVAVTGTGRCTEITIDWGDTTPKNTYHFVDLGSNPVFSHTYGGWGGGKTVTVEGTAHCAGKVNTRFDMEPSIFHLGFVLVPKATAQICHQVPNFPGVGTHNLVHITTSPATSFPGGINFGCPLNSCILDADGRLGSVANSSFPFPGLREFSLVLRVSSQVAQGGKNVTFVTTDAGSLEVCTNDSDQTDNAGGYEIDIKVDQLGP